MRATDCGRRRSRPASACSRERLERVLGSPKAGDREREGEEGRRGGEGGECAAGSAYGRATSREQARTDTVQRRGTGLRAACVTEESGRVVGGRTADQPLAPLLVTTHAPAAGLGATTCATRAVQHACPSTARPAQPRRRLVALAPSSQPAPRRLVYRTAQALDQATPAVLEQPGASSCPSPPSRWRAGRGRAALRASATSGGRLVVGHRAGAWAKEAHRQRHDKDGEAERTSILARSSRRRRSSLRGR